MILDQPENKKTITPESNNGLLRGTVFSLITMLWFFFLCAFINLDADYFSPFSPWQNGFKHQNGYGFYFIAFSFFISATLFSLIFYRKSIYPGDLLLKFGIILIIFSVLFLVWQLASIFLINQMELTGKGIGYFFHGSKMSSLFSVMASFLLFFILIYTIVLIFSKLFYSGFFNLSTFYSCLIAAVIFVSSLYFLQKIEFKLSNTKYPAMDIAVIIFFTLSTFLIGIFSGTEPTRALLKTKHNRLRNL